MLPGRTGDVGGRVTGMPREAERHATAALELSKGRDVEYAAALALGLAGDSSRSEALAGDLEKRFPEDTFAKFTYAPVLRALAALGRGQARKTAWSGCKSLCRYELARERPQLSKLLSWRPALGLRARQALMAARRYAEAAAEFQKILDHRGLVALDPIGALAHLQLGRVFALSGDTSQGPGCLRDVPHFVERCRRRYPDPEKRQSRVRQTAVMAL